MTLAVQKTGGNVLSRLREEELESGVIRSSMGVKGWGTSGFRINHYDSAGEEQMRQ
jgi:hypothetical protein